MNRTLLLILCDFLLLNLLALTRWEQVEPQNLAGEPPAIEEKDDQDAKDEPKDDMLVLLKAELEKESSKRDDLERRLQFAEANFQTQEKAMSSLRQNSGELENKLQSNQKAYQQLSQQYSIVSLTAAKNRQSVDKLSGDLVDRQKEIQETLRELAMLEEEKRKALLQSSNLANRVKLAEAERKLQKEQFEKTLAETERKRQADLNAKAVEMAALEKERLAAEKRLASLNGEVTGLNAKVQATEKEKSMLRQNVSELKTEVLVVRQEKEKLRAHTEKLTGGLQKLAATSTELTKEFRDSQAINMNQIFHEFLTNRVDVKITGTASGLFGTSQKEKITQTLLVRDITGVHAVLHVEDTPLTVAKPASGLSDIKSSVSIRGRDLAFQPLEFLGADPRLIAIPVNEALAEISGLKIYNLTSNPFKFPKAVLISKGGTGFGEVEFRLDARNPNFVKMKGGYFKRMFGEFSPSTGDLVFAKSGELLGVMVNSEFCVILKSLQRVRGTRLDQNMRRLDSKRVLEEMKLRVDKLPFSVQ
jgi:hypothetical protein